MAQGVPRRHLFDNGYPVSRATLLAGSEVLLAISSAALRSSRFRLAMCLLRLADTSGRVTASLALRDSRDNFSRLMRHGLSDQALTAVADRAGYQPGKRPAREAPDRP